METLVEGFAWLLDDCNINEIKDAMKVYLKTKSDIPAPSDIIKLVQEQRIYANVKPPTIEKLIAYQEKGIPLSPNQKDLLEAHFKQQRMQ